eukprot:c15260_g1_i1 orf=169-474(-)
MILASDRCLLHTPALSYESNLAPKSSKICMCRSNQVKCKIPPSFLWNVPKQFLHENVDSTCVEAKTKPLLVNCRLREHYNENVPPSILVFKVSLPRSERLA